MKKYHACFLHYVDFFDPLCICAGNKSLKVTVGCENRKQDESVGYEISYPVFGEKAKSLNGEIITVKGYMIPYEAYPGPKFAYCGLFFCGGAGPETVMEVFTKEAVTLTEGTIQVRGHLELNPDNPDHMMYILRDAELVE